MNILRFKKGLYKIYFIIYLILLLLFNFFKINKSDGALNLKENYNSLTFYNDFNININSNFKKDFFKYFKTYNINYFLSLKFKVVKIEYIIAIYKNDNNLIIPSDLFLYYNLNVICIIEKLKSKNIIYSLAKVYKNKYYQCTEFFNITEKIKIGIKLFKYNEKDEIIENYKDYFISKDIDFGHINKHHKNDNIFDPLIINNLYLNEIKLDDKLKNSYLQYPVYKLKINSIEKENKWKFINIYNIYFCLCKGFNCFKSKINQLCKYLFYLYIIDINRNIYKKTHFLFIDFIFKEYSSDDAYPIFEEMEKTKLPVHYITEKKNIYLKYCKNQIECLTIILVNKKNYIMNGDFLEKYLILFLRLKQVISGGGKIFNYNHNNLFYNIDYITYICVGHGISFFKRFLYSDYCCYGSKRYNKILIPPWKNLIIIVKKYGWNENNIIKMNLPKWDKFNNDYLIKKNNSITNNSCIFLMFTWRKLQKNKKISKYYFKNILALLTDIVLNKALNKNKIILYFTLHHRLNKYIKKILNKLNQLNQKYVKFIEENEIFECLSKTNLLVSDFSSVIFDLIYRRKPFIIYIPDLEDPKIKDLYVKDYYNLIESIKNGTIEFENKCFSINETINKIIYYINNNFSLEKKLENYYNNFNFKKDKNINKFINYLKNLK